jgi:EAL domain-containing protein (putative c-di-GMP-specific phosphodiesterase class I)
MTGAFGFWIRKDDTVSQAEPARGRRARPASRLDSAPTTAAEFAELVLMPGALHTVFQPILRCGARGRTLHAFECLTRGPADTPYVEAPALFGAARQWHLEAELDRACVLTAFRTVAEHAIKSALFINVHPLTLMSDPMFPGSLVAIAADHGIPPTRLTVEVIEHGRNWDARSLAAGVQALRQLGVRVALDEFGATPTDTHALAGACRPDVVKLNERLLRDTGEWATEGRGPASIVEEARDRGIQVIVEHVDGEADLRLASRLGIDLAQGHFLHRPLPAEAAAWRLCPSGSAERWNSIGCEGGTQ